MFLCWALTGITAFDLLSLQNNSANSIAINETDFCYLRIRHRSTCHNMCVIVMLDFWSHQSLIHTRSVWCLSSQLVTPLTLPGLVSFCWRSAVSSCSSASSSSFARIASVSPHVSPEPSGQWQWHAGELDSIKHSGCVWQLVSVAIYPWVDPSLINSGAASRLVGFTVCAVVVVASTNSFLHCFVLKLKAGKSRQLNYWVNT